MLTFFDKNKSFMGLALMLTLAMVFSLAPDIANATILTTAQTKICQVYQTAKNIVFIIGGLGLIVLAIFAFFGRFKWTHFFALAGGIFLVAMTTQFLAFFSASLSTCA